MNGIRSRPLDPGEAAPWIHARTLEGSEDYALDTAAGRSILMLFLGSAARPDAAAALAQVQERRALFDDENAALYGVTTDPADAENGRVRKQIPGIRFFLDYDQAVSAAFGATTGKEPAGYHPHWLLLDRALRAVATFPIDQGDAALAALESLIAAPAFEQAPVLVAPNILEPELCRELIALYEADGGEPSGFMRDVAGITKEIVDPSHKIRRDYMVQDPEIARRLRARIRDRLAPMVHRTFQFAPTRIERLLVGCYEAETGGHFRAHRDNTTKGTAHRRFAVTINLNAEDYEGGDLRFAEFGARTYRAPTGGAVVFSCSMLHQAMPVTRGRRFAFLPFLYDDAAAQLRERNTAFVEGGLASYRAKRAGGKEKPPRDAAAPE